MENHNSCIFTLQNEYLRREQDKHVKDVLVNAHESEEVVQKQEQIPFKHVEDALNEKLAAIKVEEQSVEGMKLHPLFITFTFLKLNFTGARYLIKSCKKSSKKPCLLAVLVKSSSAFYPLTLD